MIKCENYNTMNCFIDFFHYVIDNGVIFSRNWSLRLQHEQAPKTHCWNSMRGFIRNYYIGSEYFRFYLCFFQSQGGVWTPFVLPNVVIALVLYCISLQLNIILGLLLKVVAMKSQVLLILIHKEITNKMIIGTLLF